MLSVNYVLQRVPYAVLDVYIDMFVLFVCIAVHINMSVNLACRH